ncbi:MAG TPA: CHC2 zinc finger domain-containing protein [Candidatus Acidoferrales bacterium]
MTKANEVAAHVPMVEMLRVLGFQVNERTRRGACILHGGSNPTAFSWQEDGRWHCFSCGAGGDRIALVRTVRQCGFRESVQFLADLAGIEYRVNQISHDEIARARHEREAELATARLLVVAENDALREARENLWALNDVRRMVSARLDDIRNGACERWPGEWEFGWHVLQSIADQIPRADTAYCITSFAAPDERARFALHAEQRDAMVQGAFERGYVANAKGYRFEVNL